MAKLSRYEELDIDTRLPEIEAMARNGDTDVIMCKKLGVARQTFSNWKKQYPEFAEALRKGKEVVDAEVENELLESARGRVYWEETQELQWHTDEKGNIIRDEDGNPTKKMVTVKRVLKRDTPSVTAQIFWLKNRKPADWRDKQNVEHSGVIGTTEMGHLKDDELDAAIKKLRG